MHFYEIHIEIPRTVCLLLLLFVKNSVIFCTFHLIIHDSHEDLIINL